jgi:hypothetical protein
MSSAYVEYAEYFSSCQTVPIHGTISVHTQTCHFTFLLTRSTVVIQNTVREVKKLGRAFQEDTVVAPRSNC